MSEFLRSGWFLSLTSGQVLIGWGEMQASSAPSSHAESCSLYAPDFYLSIEKPWWMTAHWDLLDRDRFSSHVLASIAHNVNVEDQRFQWVEPRFDEFKMHWLAIRDGMEKRSLEKAVPVVFAESQARLHPERKLQILSRLTELPVSLHIYGLWGECSDSPFGIMGATPELLFSQQRPDEIETMALAGTCGKGIPGAAAGLLRDAKERHEHQLVIGDIENVLSRVGKVTVDETGIMELPTLFHLRTLLRARLNRRVEFGEIVRLLHPTPALGVAPRELGFAEIRLWDSRSLSEGRARYGAPFGVLAHGPGEQKISECVVAIRNIQWQGDEMHLGSGCGVVLESEIEREWRELQLKRDSVKRILGV